jgi:Asp/Glu/hydantoin racemase
MARILVIIPFAFDQAGIDRRRDQLKAVALEPGSEVHFLPVKAGPTSFMSPHDWASADLAIFEAGANAQNDGFDAVCIDTMSDSGMAALRSVLNIPGSCQAARRCCLRSRWVRNSPYSRNGSRRLFATAKRFRSWDWWASAPPCARSTWSRRSTR